MNTNYKPKAKKWDAVYQILKLRDFSILWKNMAAVHLNKDGTVQQKAGKVSGNLQKKKDFRD